MHTFQTIQFVSRENNKEGVIQETENDKIL